MLGQKIYCRNKYMTNAFSILFPSQKPLIGMIHLPDLPGGQSYLGVSALVEKALIDLDTLQKAGFNSVMVENFEKPGFVGATENLKNIFLEVVKAVVKKATVPVGMEIIYDMPATIKVAYLAGAKFVRLDVFVDDVETRWGKVKSEAKKIQSMRDKLGNGKLVLLTDIHVKHAKLLSEKTLEESALEAITYGSDGIIITGNWTGLEPDIEEIRQVKSIVRDNLPVLVGSGLNISNIQKLISLADGAIVGTSIKTGKYVDYEKARTLVKFVQKLKQKEVVKNGRS